MCLWYMVGLPVTQIARRVRVSRMHCYRLRNIALDRMLSRPESFNESARGAS